MSRQEKLRKIILPIILLLAGALVMLLMVTLRPEPGKTVKPDSGALVELLAAQPEKRPVRIFATGTVQSRQEITLTPQVRGRVVWLAPHFVAGGFFRAGEPLFRLEPTDYAAGVERARAALAKAELELATTESRARIARQEWEALHTDAAPPNALVLHEPQLKDARNNLEAARANLALAELDLARTEFFAPFDCRVRAEQIDIGQYVKDGTSVATLIGTDLAEIIVPLPLGDLTWLDVPAAAESRPGSRAIVSFTVNGQRFTWQGAIDRSLGEVDPQGRMLRVAVSVDDPYHLKQPNDTQPDLVTGLFVEVTILGTPISAYAIPRKALREGNTVWIMDSSRQLRIRPVQVARTERDLVLITEGLNPGDRTVLTNLSGAAEGMLLRTAEREATP